MTEPAASPRQRPREADVRLAVGKHDRRQGELRLVELEALAAPVIRKRHVEPLEQPAAPVRRTPATCRSRSRSAPSGGRRSPRAARPAASSPSSSGVKGTNGASSWRSRPARSGWTAQSTPSRAKSSTPPSCAVTNVRPSTWICFPSRLSVTVSTARAGVDVTRQTRTTSSSRGMGGVVGWGNAGMLEYWNDGVMEC